MSIVLLIILFALFILAGLFVSAIFGVVIDYQKYKKMVEKEKQNENVN